MNDFNKLVVERKTGEEHFHLDEQQLDINLLMFWQWCMSDLVNNTTRGRLAEYLVASDLGMSDGIRVEWDAYDVRTKHGLKVEVKSAAYLQSWQQTKASAIS